MLGRAVDGWVPDPEPTPCRGRGVALAAPAFKGHRSAMVTAGLICRNIPI